MLKKDIPILYSPIAKKVISIATILTISSLSFFIANIILGRILSKSDYGYFQFIRTVTFILPLIVVLGMDCSFIRYFSKIGITNYNWHKNLFISTRNTILLSFPVVLFIHFYYDIYWLHSLFIFLILCIYGSFLISNSILRINSYYSKAQFLTSGWRILFLIIVSVLFAFGLIEKNIVVLAYSLVFAVFIVFNWIFLRKIPVGSVNVPNLLVFKKGFLFFLVTASGIIMTQLDRFFISKMLGFESLGIFVAVSLVIITIFNLMGTSVGYVLMPYLAKGNKIDVKLTVIFIISISLIFFMIFSFYGEKINHILFNGKYDGYNNLIIIFIFIGILQFIYNFIYFSLGGIGNNKDFVNFFYFILLSIIIFIISSLILIPKKNLVGAAIATLLSWFIRDIGGIVILIRKK